MQIEERTPEVWLGDNHLDCADPATEAAMLDRFQHIDGDADAADLPYVSGILLTVVDKPHITAGGTVGARLSQFDHLDRSRFDHLSAEQREVLFAYLDR